MIAPHEWALADLMILSDNSSTYRGIHMSYNRPKNRQQIDGVYDVYTFPGAGTAVVVRALRLSAV